MEALFFREYTNYINEWGFTNELNDSSFFEIKQNLISFKFCGFINLNGYLICVFPKGFPLENTTVKEKQHDARLLLKVFKKYNQRSIINTAIHSHNLEKIEGTFFSLAHEIISDYQKHGLLTSKEKKQSLNGPGKTNWAKTIKKVNPIIQNNNLMYLDLINEKHLKSLSNDLIKIHWNILRDIEEKVGWLYNFNLVNLTISASKINVKKATTVIKLAISKTYNQNIIRRLKLLLSYLNNNYISDSKLTNFSLMYTLYFQNIWEDIIKVVFEDNYLIHQKVPHYKWKNGNLVIKSSPIIPDTLTYSDFNELLIIDAKYYPELGETSSSSKLPNSSDISKQLIYRKSLYYLPELENIYNIFILPGVVPANNNFISEIARVGFEEHNLLNDLGEIITFQLDIKTSMQHYLLNNSNLKLTLLDKLI